ncbi:MAG: XRE family transcriptional regulator [Bacteroidetes bacterium]|nr:MAG: XRE family transcriptional regulator [Bacteroidota bacterium]
MSKQKTLGHFTLNNGEDVKSVREYLGLTQRELAVAMGYRRYQTISEYENGKPIPERFKIALRSLYVSKISERV